MADNGGLSIDEAIEGAERIAKFLREWADTTQPEPIKPGDYVRLTGADWEDGTVVDLARGRVYPVDHVDRDGTAYVGDWAVWPPDVTGPGWEVDRITVTADLDDPWNLPIPEVGEWVWWERRDGHIAAGRVEAVNMGETYASVVIEDGLGASICTDPNCWVPEGDLIAWGTYDPADLTPDEPTTFGYVGYATDEVGDVWDVINERAKSNAHYWLTRRSDGIARLDSWPDVLALGTFTAVER